MTTKKISCLVVDDEPPALMVIEKYIRAVALLQFAGQCNNAVDAFARLQGGGVDLLFLDIQMPFILGTDFIRTLVNPPKVIFTTAFREFAVEGFELDAVDYLLKPISFERFLKAVNKVMKLQLPVVDNFLPDSAPKNEPETAFIILRADRRNLKVRFEDILFVESLKDYVKVVTKDKVIVSKHSITTICDSLPPHLFVRIHRSFIVSIHKIISFTAELVQIGKYELPVSRSYRHEVERALKHLKE
jgi:DNA-binding LytR/AlgR family response regulator